MDSTEAAQALGISPTSSPGACFHLLNFLIPAQEAFNAFAHLIEQSPESASWDGIANWCRVIQVAWENTNLEPMVASGSWTYEESARDAWVIARGSALQKISPDALVRFLEHTRAFEAEQRLRVYFFDKLWGLLPGQAQNALIAADHAFWATEGRRNDIFENLRLATEAVVGLVLIDPFRIWMLDNPQTQDRSSKVTPTQNEPYLPIARQLKELWSDNEESFKTFTSFSYPGAETAYWSYLRSGLRALAEIRNQAVHPEDRGHPREESISNIYRIFLGIGQRGILPDLLKLSSAPTIRVTAP